MRVPRRACPVLAQLLFLLALAGAGASAQPLPGEAARDQKIARLVATTEASPKDVGSWHDLATLFREAGRWDQAIDAETRAIELHPKYAVAFYGRGVARMEKRDYRAAGEDFTAAIALWESRGGVERFITTERPRPEYVDSYRDRGVALAHQGKLSAAVADLGTALRLRPDDPRLLFERGHLLEKAGRPAEAVADFRRAGLVRAEAGDAAGARVCAERLRKLDATKAAAEVEGRLVPAPRGTDPP